MNDSIGKLRHSVTPKGRLSTSKLFLMWLAWGLGLGLLAGVQVYVATDGKILRSLALVGVGLVVGCLIATVYAIVLRSRS